MDQQNLPGGDGREEGIWEKSLEIVYGVLFQPGKAFRQLADRPIGWVGAFAFLLATVVNFAAGLILAPASPGAATGGALLGSPGGGTFDPTVVANAILSLRARLGWAIFPMDLAVGLAMWLLGAAVVHLASELIGGEGRASSLLALMGLAKLPYVFVAPLALVARYTWPGVASLGGVVILIWVLALYIVAIGANYGFGTGRAVAALVLPLMATLAAIMVVFFTTALALVPMLPGGGVGK